MQRSHESLRFLAKRYGINQKTVAKWKRRASVDDVPTGPKDARSTVLSVGDEAVIVAFRKHTLLPLWRPADDCLYALQPTLPHLTRSSLHRCLQRHGMSQLPSADGEVSAKRKFKAYPIGYFRIDIAEVRTAQGKLYLLVAIDRTSKFAFVELHEQVPRSTAADFLRRLVAAVPYKVAMSESCAETVPPLVAPPAGDRGRCHRRLQLQDVVRFGVDERGFQWAGMRSRWSGSMPCALARGWRILLGWQPFLLRPSAGR